MSPVFGCVWTHVSAWVVCALHVFVRSCLSMQASVCACMRLLALWMLCACVCMNIGGGHGLWPYMHTLARMCLRACACMNCGRVWTFVSGPERAHLFAYMCFAMCRCMFIK
jgi:hypothetical protein